MIGISNFNHSLKRYLVKMGQVFDYFQSKNLARYFNKLFEYVYLDIKSKIHRVLGPLLNLLSEISYFGYY